MWLIKIMEKLMSVVNIKKQFSGSVTQARREAAAAYNSWMKSGNPIDKLTFDNALLDINSAKVQGKAKAS